jgi:hypothetical protein
MVKGGGCRLPSESCDLLWDFRLRFSARDVGVHEPLVSG